MHIQTRRQKNKNKQTNKQQKYNNKFMVRTTIRMKEETNDIKIAIHWIIWTHNNMYSYIFVMLKFLKKTTKLIFCKIWCELSNVKQYFLNCQSFSSSDESDTQVKIFAKFGKIVFGFDDWAHKLINYKKRRWTNSRL